MNARRPRLTTPSERRPSAEPKLLGGRWIPDPERFRHLHRPGISIPVLLEVSDQGLDAVQLFAALTGGVSTAYLLESAGGPADLGRRTFMAWDPEREYVLRGTRLETWSAGRCVARRRTRTPLADLRAALAAEGATPMPHADGLSGGLIGYIAYDFKNALERLPDRVQDDLGVPELRLGLVRGALSWDHRARTLRLRYSVRCGESSERDLSRAYDEILALYGRVQDLAALLRAASPRQAKRETPRRSGRPAAAAVRGAAGREQGAQGSGLKLQSNLTRAAYDRMLERAHEHILAGDIYQANLSHRFEAPFRGEGLGLYRKLRDINPSPFATYMRFPEHEVVSCSPERLVRLEHGHVETRPIAGTRPRGADRADDRRMQRQLLVDEKERAEHLMIVDMARNDIGRVCEAGSVRVERFMRPEAYSHVRHLVSNITGTLRQDRDAFDLLAATFPGASITGVPKVRCMQIIDELETVRRGIYTGSAGYFSLDGSMDCNILIRTFLLQDGRAYFQVGGGIVADSDPEREYEETLAKGRALQEALFAVTPKPDAAVKRATKKPARRAAGSEPSLASG